MALQEAQVQVPEWSFGDRLRKARTTAHIDRDAMAELMGVTPGNISHWEGDRSRPRDIIDVATRWATATGVSVQWILGLVSMYFSTDTRGFDVMEWESDAAEQIALPLDAHDPRLRVV